MTISIRHIGIVVNDLKACQSFWEEVMGFHIISEMLETGRHLDLMMNLENVNVKTVKMANIHNQLIELLYFTSHHNSSKWLGCPYSTGLTHIAFTVDDLDSVLKKSAAMGYNTRAKPQVSPNAIAKVIYVEGPEGLLLELVEVLNA